MTSKIPEDFSLSHAEEVEEILRRAVRQALLAHKRAGNPIAVWKEGKVVIIPPEEIEADEPAQSPAW